MSRAGAGARSLAEHADRAVLTILGFMRCSALYASFQLRSGEERGMIIRVLLGVATRMEESALQGALAGCDDIELVRAESGGPATDIDVLVLQEAAMGEFPALLRTIAAVRRVGVVAIGDDGEAASLYRVDRQGWRFTSGGQPGLAEAIRAVAVAG